MGFGGAGVFAEHVTDGAWKNETTLTFLDAQGNTLTRTLGLNQSTQWSHGRWVFEGALEGLNSSDDGERKAEQYAARQKARWSWASRRYFYQRMAWESDRFAGYRHRYQPFLGLGQEVFKSGRQQWAFELGAGYLNEQRLVGPRVDSASGRAYTLYSWGLSDTASFSQDGEYLHSFDQPRDYHLNTGTSLTATLSTHLSMKTSFSWKYSHSPPETFKRNDTLTQVSLLITY